MDRRAFIKALTGGLATSFGGRAAGDPPHARSAIIPETYVHPTLASSTTEAVGMRLVCLYDISGSITNAEHQFQLEAMAEAITSTDFHDAIFYTGGPKSIAICFANFGSNVALQIPWVDIRKGDDHKYEVLANQILTLKRREALGTHQVVALNFSRLCLQNCPWRGDRNVVDMMTDGTDNEGLGNAEEKLKEVIGNLATDENATVNILLTTDPASPGLEEWARENLVTPPSFIKPSGVPLDAGFLKIVATQKTDNNALVEYQRAMTIGFRRKLILEVAGLELDDLRIAARAQPPAFGLG